MPTIPSGAIPIESSVSAGSSRGSSIERLKDQYLPKLEDHTNVATVIAGLIAQPGGKIGGHKTVGSFLRRNPQSAGIWFFENQALATPDASESRNPIIYSRATHTRLRWTGHSERSAAGGDKFAWATPRQEDMRAARSQAMLNFARSLHLGPYQALGVINGAVAASTTVILHGRDARNSSANKRYAFGARHIYEGMKVMFQEPTGGGAVDAGGATGAIDATSEWSVSAIDLSDLDNPTLTLSAVASVGDNGVIVPYGSRRQSNGTIDGGVVGADGAAVDSLFASCNGLDNILAVSAKKEFYLGLDRDDNPTLEVIQDDGGGVVRPWDENRIALAADRVKDDGLGGDVKIGLCHSSVRREYVRETASDRRFAPVLKKKGFAGRLQFAAGDQLVALFTDRHCAPGVMYLFDKSDFKWLENTPWKMADKGERFVADQDSREIVLVRHGNEIGMRPQNAALVDDIEYKTAGLVAA